MCMMTVSSSVTITDYRSIFLHPQPVHPAGPPLRMASDGETMRKRNFRSCRGPRLLVQELTYPSLTIRFSNVVQVTRQELPSTRCSFGGSHRKSLVTCQEFECELRDLDLSRGYCIRIPTLKSLAVRIETSCESK